jgi:tetratricopeptide (TPR) repeat protein
MIGYIVFALLTVSLCISVAAQENVVNEESGTLYREGLTLFNSGKFDEAAGLFEKSYAADERNINALFANGLALSRSGKNKEAAEIFTAVLEKDPTHENALKMLPASYERDGQIEQALAAYDKGIEASPNTYISYYGKAVLQIKLTKYEEAIELLKKAVALQPKMIEIHEKLLYAYRESGDLENAKKTADSIVTQDENNGRARLVIADYYRMNQQYDEAMTQYELAASNIETKAYAEHYIEVIKQTLEEIEIEEEYQARMNNQ